MITKMRIWLQVLRTGWRKYQIEQARRQSEQEQRRLIEQANVRRNEKIERLLQLAKQRMAALKEGK